MFGFIIGKCAVIVPPSAKAAVAITLYFFGVGASASPAFTADFHDLLRGQYVAAGKTAVEAAAAVKHFDACVDSYEITPEKQR